MRSTLTQRRDALDQMPRGQPAPVSLAKVMGKAHRVDILRALASAEAGLTYGEIDLDITRRSGTNLILNELCIVGLVVWKTDRYHITSAGKKSLAAAEALGEVRPISNGNGGVGVPK